MKLHFKKWLVLQETGTSTGDIAGFRQPIMGMVRRIRKGNKRQCGLGGVIQTMKFGSSK